METARVTAPGPIDSSPLALETLPQPRPGPGQIAVSIAACAVCRTDLQIAEGDLPARCLPITPGHQVVGTVSELGTGVASWQVGDRVGVGWLARTCGACGYCRSGRENLCGAAVFTGWDIDGGFAQTLVADAGFAFRLPPAIPDRAAAPLLCGGVIGYRSLRISGIEPGGRLGLYGFGSSASLCIQVARHWGCRVYVFTRSSAERDRALALGATWTGEYDEEPPAPLQAAVTFAPVGAVVVAALRAVGPGGTVAVNAIHLDRVPEFSYDYLWRERSLRSVANFTRADAAEFLELAAKIPIVTRVTEYPLSAATSALAALASGNTTGTAVLVPRRDR